MARYEYGLSLKERLDDFWERIWLCEIRRIHRIKMQSYGHCIRCDRKVK